MLRYEKVLLIYPRYRESWFSERNIYPPPGIGYLEEVLKVNGVKCFVIDMTLGQSVDDIFDKVENERVELLGISMMTFGYKEHYNLLLEIKTRFPEIKIVAGGPHVTAFKDKVLMDCEVVDYGVVGEGEYTMLELCTGRELNEIKGLMWRDDGRIVFNGPRDFINDLDSISFPKYGGFDMNQYNEVAIVSSRGCPFRCIFCEYPTLYGRKYRKRSVESIIDEIEFWYKAGRRRINFCDDNFALDRGRVIRICEEIKARGLNELKLSSGNMRADRIDPELLMKMREAGFQSVSIGVESGSDKVLKTLRKGVDVGTIEKAIKIACDLGFAPKLYFVVGTPHESFEDFKKSMELAQKYPVSQVRFFSLMPAPNTELLRWVQENGKLLYQYPEYLSSITPDYNKPFFDGPGMSIREKVKALELGKRTARKVHILHGKTKWRRFLKPLADILFDTPLYHIVLFFYNAYRKIRSWYA